MITAEEALSRAIALAEAGTEGGGITGPSPDGLRAYAAMARTWLDIYMMLHARERTADLQEYVE